MKIKDVLNAVMANNMSVDDAEKVIDEQFAATKRGYEQDLRDARRPYRVGALLGIVLGLGLLGCIAFAVQSCQKGSQAELDYRVKTQACRTESFNAGREACKEDLVKVLQSIGVNLPERH